MHPRLLLDTHIVICWLTEQKRLSRDQRRALDQATNRSEPLAISAISLLELAVLMLHKGARLFVPAQELLNEIGTNPIFRIIPLTVEIAGEAAAMGEEPRDPADRAIVATARFHRLTLVTSDRRILDSGLVSTIE